MVEPWGRGEYYRLPGCASRGALGGVGDHRAGHQGQASGRQGDGVAALPAAVALAVVPLGRWAVGRGGHEDSPCAAVALTDS